MCGFVVKHANQCYYRCVLCCEWNHQHNINACISLPGDRFNIKILPYHFRDSNYKDKTVLRPSCLYNENVHTWKDGHYIVTGPRIRFYQNVKSNENPIPIQHNTAGYIIVSFNSICCVQKIKSNHSFGSRLHIGACYWAPKWWSLRFEVN